MTSTDQNTQRRTSCHPPHTRQHHRDPSRDAVSARPGTADDGNCIPTSDELTLLSFQLLSRMRDRGGFANHAVAEKWALLVINLLHQCLPPPDADALRALLPHPFDTDLRPAHPRQPPVTGSHGHMLNLFIKRNGGLTDSGATHRITAILETVSDLQTYSPHIGGATARDYANAVVNRALRPGNDSAATLRSGHDVSADHEVASIPNSQGSQ